MRQINFVTLSNGRTYWCESYRLYNANGLNGIAMSNVWELKSLPQYDAHVLEVNTISGSTSVVRPWGAHVWEKGRFQYAELVDSENNIEYADLTITYTSFCRQESEPESPSDCLKPFWKTKQWAEEMSTASRAVAEARVEEVEKEIAEYQKARELKEVPVATKRPWWKFWK